MTLDLGFEDPTFAVNPNSQVQEFFSRGGDRIRGATFTARNIIQPGELLPQRRIILGPTACPKQIVAHEAVHAAFSTLLKTGTGGLGGLSAGELMQPNSMKSMSYGWSVGYEEDKVDAIIEQCVSCR